ncbi:MAG: hypothetical protein AAFY66_07205 [Pseudomonadota bacterium]
MRTAISSWPAHDRHLRFAVAERPDPRYAGGASGAPRGRAMKKTIRIAVIIGVVVLLIILNENRDW